MVEFLNYSYVYDKRKKAEELYLLNQQNKCVKEPCALAGYGGRGVHFRSVFQMMGLVWCVCVCISWCDWGGREEGRRSRWMDCVSVNARAGGGGL